MRFRGSLLIAALLMGAVAAPVALGEELQLDSQTLDASGAAAKTKGKKAKKQQQPQAAAPAAKPTKPGGDRQFGELEGWSPGKAPPKPAEHESGSAAPAKGPVGISPSGGMSVGLPF
jgi:hypothetical protein